MHRATRDEWIELVTGFQDHNYRQSWDYAAMMAKAVESAVRELVVSALARPLERRQRLASNDFAGRARGSRTLQEARLSDKARYSDAWRASRPSLCTHSSASTWSDGGWCCVSRLRLATPLGTASRPIASQKAGFAVREYLQSYRTMFVDI